MNPITTPLPPKLPSHANSAASFWGLCVLAVLVTAGPFWYCWPKAGPFAAAPIQVARSLLTLKEGRLHRVGQPVPFTGVMAELRPNGKLLSRSDIVEGRLHGVSEGWHSDGTLQVREHFRSGVSHGTRTKWHPTGAKLSEATIVAGRIEGTFRQWHENGVLAQQIEMKGGQPEGWSRAFDLNGALKARVLMRDGKVVTQESRFNGESRVGSATESETP